MYEMLRKMWLLYKKGSRGFHCAYGGLTAHLSVLALVLLIIRQSPVLAIPSIFRLAGIRLKQENLHCCFFALVIMFQWMTLCAGKSSNTSEALSANR